LVVIRQAVERSGAVGAPTLSRGTVLALLVVLCAACGGQLPAEREPPQDVANRTQTRTNSALDPKRFVPKAKRVGEREVVPLTFPDGTRIVLSYPAELRLVELGVQPDVSYLYRDDSAARYPLTFLYRAPDPAPAAGEIILRAGGWTVVAPVWDSAARDEIVNSLSTHETGEGFAVVEAKAPLALSHEFGEGGGVMLALGDDNPVPARVTSLDPLIELAPGDCGRESEIEGVGGSLSYGSTCLGDRVYVGVYGKRRFIEAVLSRLELEGGSRPDA
jgi:hypothetical protein